MSLVGRENSEKHWVGGGFNFFLTFTLTLGKWSNLTNFFFLSCHRMCMGSASPDGVQGGGKKNWLIFSDGFKPPTRSEEFLNFFFCRIRFVPWASKQFQWISEDLFEFWRGWKDDRLPWGDTTSWSLDVFLLFQRGAEEPLRIQSPSENGFMEPKYYAFRKWLDTPIIILRIRLHS